MLLLLVEGTTVLVERGLLLEAVETGEAALDRARLSGNPRMLLWALSALSTARLAEGDVSAALQLAGEAAALEVRPDVHAAGQPGWALGAALTAAGNADRAVAAMLGSFGGAGLPDVVPGERPAAAADLVEAQLALGDLAAAEAALMQGEAAAARAGTPWVAGVTGVARSSVLLARGEAREAVAAAVAAWQSAVDAPLLSARAQLAEGRALAATDDRALAIETLIAAESALDAMGAMRLRDQAVRELRRLGHRVVRPAAGHDPGRALSMLTPRQRDIAVLVAQGRTNREVAEQLVLSIRTVEAHLRSIYTTLEVRSRTELAHALQRGDTW
jgi:DNA-binding NarL/FixJ family response regulator